MDVWRFSKVRIGRVAGNASSIICLPSIPPQPTPKIYFHLPGQKWAATSSNGQWQLWPIFRGEQRKNTKNIYLLSKMINITCFWSFGAILGLFGPFFIFSHKTWFFAYKTQRASWQKWFGAKTKVLCEMTKKSPNGPKMAPNGQKHVILIIWGHFGPS